MAIISVYVPDDELDRVIIAMAANYRYSEEIRHPEALLPLITWAASTDPEDEAILLLIAQELGYTGALPGTEVQDTFTSSDPTEVLAVAQTAGFEGTEIPDPIVLPFLAADTVLIGTYIQPTVNPFIRNKDNGLLGVITGYNPSTIPNPESKPEFTNRAIRKFLTDNVKAYELEEARKAAENAVNSNTGVTVEDGSTATIHHYLMVCLTGAKAQYDAVASFIAPGNTFGIELSVDGNAPATHYGLEAGVTETAKNQLSALELAGNTSVGGVQTLYYVRCDPDTGIAQATNIADYAIVGQPCTFSDLIAQLGLVTI